MKKKLFIVLFVFIILFTLTGCGKNEKINDESKEKQENNQNQTGYVEGQYSIDDLTFNLSEGCKPSFQENIYQLADDNNAIVFYFYHDKNIKTSLGEYIDSDPHDFLPNQKNIEPATINGNNWYKGVTNDNAYIYYIQRGNDVYSIMIMPMFTTKTVLNEAISTLESSLYFKNN